MDYILVENRQIVHLHTSWKPRFIQSELDDLEVDYKVPPAEIGYIRINSNFEIIPVIGTEVAPWDLTFNCLAGPFYDYQEQAVVARYDVLDLDLGSIKNNLKQKVAVERYRKEQLGTTVVINGSVVNLFTDRENRNQYVTLVASIGEGTVNWKCNAGFVAVDKVAAQSMLAAVNTYVQTQFNWEQQLGQQIDACTTIEELKNIVIVEPTQPGV